MASTRQPTPGELRRLALHEAGHAIAAVVLHRRFIWVRIDPARGNGLLRCTQHPCLDMRRRQNRSRIRHYIKREVVIAWCGLVAEEMGTGKRRLAGMESDAEMIDALLRRLEPAKRRRNELGRPQKLRKVSRTPLSAESTCAVAHANRHVRRWDAVATP